MIFVLFQKHRYPKSVFYIVGNEFCERFSYYGMRSKYPLCRTYLIYFYKKSVCLVVKTTRYYHFSISSATSINTVGKLSKTLSSTWLLKTVFRKLYLLSTGCSKTKLALTGVFLRETGKSGASCESHTYSSRHVSCRWGRGLQALRLGRNQNWLHRCLILYLVELPQVTFYYKTLELRKSASLI